MPKYRVTDPQTGQTLELTGDSPPTEAELEQIFSSQGTYSSGSAPVIRSGAPIPLTGGQDVPAQTPMLGSESSSVAMGIADYPIGLLQAILQPPQYAEGGVDLGFDESKAYTPIRDVATAGHEGLTSALRDVNQQIDVGREARGRGTGTDWWRTGGNILAGLKGAGKIPAPKSLPQLAKQGGVLGTVFGGLTPTTSEDPGAERALNVALGAGGGALLPPAVVGGAKLVGGAARTGRNIVDPFLPGGVDRASSRLLKDVVGDKSTAIRQALTGPVDPNMTAAQAAAPAGSAELSALGRRVAKRDPSGYTDITKAQNQARLAEVRSVGQTPEALAKAQKVRTGTAAQNYSEAYKQSVRGDKVLSELFRNPFASSALTDASRLAKAEGIKIKNGVVRPEDLSRFTHFVKISLDKLIAKTGDDALSNTERAAADKVKKGIVNWLKSKNPAYDEARTTFAEQSIPINQMQIGQELEKRLIPALSEEAPQRAAGFAQAMRDAPGTIKRATGARYNTLEEAMSAPQMRSLDRVQGSLANEAADTTLARAGSERINRLIGEIGSERAPGMLSRPIMVLNNLLSRSGSSRQGAVLDDLAEAMKTPQGLLRLLPEISKKEAVRLRGYLQGLPSMQNILRVAAPISAQGVQ